MSYFPMFVNLDGKQCLVAGGGKVAYRKVKVLKEFGADITVTAPEIMEEILQMDGVHCIQKSFECEDLKNKELVIAASADKELNRKISRECRKLKIPVNAVDQIEDCDFIFPSYVKQGEVTAAFSSGGQSPVITQYLKEKSKSYVTEYIGQTAECLGGIREEVKMKIASEAERKAFYREILQQSLERHQIPNQEELRRKMELYCEKLEEK